MSTHKNLKFKAKNSSYFYSILLNYDEISLFKSITNKDNRIIILFKAEEQNNKYKQEVANSGKSYGNRDEAYYSLYNASKYILGMGEIHNILNNITGDYKEHVECKLNGMHIYIALKIISTVYSAKADELIKHEKDYNNNSIITMSEFEYINKKNNMIEELESIQKLDVKLRSIFNPKDIILSEAQFNNCDTIKLDAICKMRPKE